MLSTLKQGFRGPSVILRSSFRCLTTSNLKLIAPVPKTAEQKGIIEGKILKAKEREQEKGDWYQYKTKKRNMVYGVFLGGALAYGFYTISNADCPLWWFGTKIGHMLLGPETAHHLVIAAAWLGLLPVDLFREDPQLVTHLAGLTFTHPIGLAAGFDKEADGPLSFISLGFSHIEVGTVTPEPQPGNPEPRIFRLSEDKAVINRCGFNSKGAEHVRKNLRRARLCRPHRTLQNLGVIGVNLGKNKESTDAAADYVKGVEQLGEFADYLVINVSSPNTPGLRDLQQTAELKNIITKVQEAITKIPTRYLRNRYYRGKCGKSWKPSTDNKFCKTDEKSLEDKTVETGDKTVETGDKTETGDAGLTVEQVFKKPTSKKYQKRWKLFQKYYGNSIFATENQEHIAIPPPPLFVKVSPDLTEEERQEIAKCLVECKVDGIIVANTTVSRPESLKSPLALQEGGLSGPPLKDLSTKCVWDFYKFTDGKIPIIASGGVERGLDAMEKIEAGATLVQVYTSFIYEGPSIAHDIKMELGDLFRQRGYHDMEEA
eukprot:Platyproteum_vivax@DN5577_c0_g1_i1.p1